MLLYELIIRWVIYMNNLQLLKEEEKYLGKKYCEWSCEDKINYLLKTNFKNLKKSLDDIEQDYHLIVRSLKKRLSTISEQLGIYDIIKRIYNKFR